MSFQKKSISTWEIPRLAILGALIHHIASPQKTYANPFYVTGCRNAVNGRHPGLFSAETTNAYCKCQRKSRGKNNDHCALIHANETYKQDFANEEEPTIVAMSIIICRQKNGHIKQ